MLKRNVNSVYLSGPMTGYDFYNFPAFHDAAKDLRRRYKRLSVHSPAEMDELDGVVAPQHTKLEYTPRYIQFLRRDISIIANGGVDALVMLDGWAQSRGAVAEVTVALLLEVPVYTYPELEPIREDFLRAVCAQALTGTRE